MTLLICIYKWFLKDVQSLLSFVYFNVLLSLVTDSKTKNGTPVGWYRYKFQNNNTTAKNILTIMEVIAIGSL